MRNYSAHPLATADCPGKRNPISRIFIPGMPQRRTASRMAPPAEHRRRAPHYRGPRRNRLLLLLVLQILYKQPALTGARPLAFRSRRLAAPRVISDHPYATKSIVRSRARWWCARARRSSSSPVAQRRPCGTARATCTCTPGRRRLGARWPPGRVRARHGTRTQRVREVLRMWRGGHTVFRPLSPASIVM